MFSLQCELCSFDPSVLQFLFTRDRVTGSFGLSAGWDAEIILLSHYLIGLCSLMTASRITVRVLTPRLLRRPDTRVLEKEISLAMDSFPCLEPFRQYRDKRQPKVYSKPHSTGK